MNISLKVRSTSKEWELKNSVTGLDLESSLYDSPTSLTFDVLGVGELFPNGSSVELLIDDKQVFKVVFLDGCFTYGLKRTFTP